MFFLSTVREAVVDIYSSIGRRTANLGTLWSVGIFLGIYLLYLSAASLGAVFLWQIELLSDQLPHMENKTECLINHGFWQSLSLANAASSTIGYGVYVPCSNPGRFFLVLYTIISLPLNLLLLNTIGSAIYECLKLVWIQYQEHEYQKRKDEGFETVKGFRGRIKSLAGKARKSFERLNMGQSWRKLPKPSFDSKVRTDSMIIRQVEFKRKPVPIFLGFGLCAFWVTMCVIYFSVTGDAFDIKTSIYFSIISLSTVGLGDVAPTDDGPICILNNLILLTSLATVSTFVSILRDNVAYTLEELEKQYKQQFKNKLLAGTNGIVEGEKGGVSMDKAISGWRSMFVSEREKHTLIEEQEKVNTMVSIGIQVSAETSEARVGFTAKLSEVGVSTDQHHTALYTHFKREEAGKQKRPSRPQARSRSPVPLNKRPPWTSVFSNPEKEKKTSLN